MKVRLERTKHGLKQMGNKCKMGVRLERTFLTIKPEVIEASFVMLETSLHKVNHFEDYQMLFQNVCWDMLILSGHICRIGDANVYYKGDPEASLNVAVFEHGSWNEYSRRDAYTRFQCRVGNACPLFRVIRTGK